MMSTLAPLAAFTISDTTLDGLAAFLLLVLLIDSLIISFSVKQGTLLTVSD